METNVYDFTQAKKRKAEIGGTQDKIIGAVLSTMAIGEEPISVNTATSGMQMQKLRSTGFSDSSIDIKQGAAINMPSTFQPGDGNSVVKMKVCLQH